MENWKLCLIRDASFASNLRDSTLKSGGPMSVFWIAHVLFPLTRMCKKQTAVSHSSAENEKIRSTQVYVWKMYEIFNVDRAHWKHCLAKRLGRTLSVTKATESFFPSRILTILCWSLLTTFRLPKGPLKPTPHIRRQCAVIQVRTKLASVPAAGVAAAPVAASFGGGTGSHSF